MYLKIYIMGIKNLEKDKNKWKKKVKYSKHKNK